MLAQADSIASTTEPSISFNGFIDAFYSYDFNNPTSDYRQSFLFNHNRHNEFNVNLALLEAKVSHQKYHALIGIQTGTYAHDNYAAEKDVFKLVNQAYAGISLNKKNTLWADVGIFSSHLGFESAVSMDNLTLTRSLVAENSPYFLTGAKVYYQTKTTTALIMVSNGWQRIQRLQANSLPGIGTQLQHVFLDKMTLNWSTYLGSEYPDSLRKMRFFNNFYAILELSDKWTVIADYDIGAEQQSLNSNQYHMWQGAAIISRYKISQKTA
ncbi:MAG: porin, partial [Bacteroidetes bacterium]